MQEVMYPLPPEIAAASSAYLGRVSTHHFQPWVSWCPSEASEVSEGDLDTQVWDLGSTSKEHKRA